MALLRLLVALVLALGAGPSAAQEPNAPSAAAPPATAAAPPTPAPPTPIAAPEVVTRAEETKAALKQIEARIAPGATEAEVQTKLPEMRAKIAERSPRAEAALGAAASLDALADLGGEWSTRADKLTDWRHALTRRALAIESELDTLASQEATWKATLDAGARGAYPAATMDRVREVLDALGDAEKAVKKRRTQILSLQNDVAQQELLVSGVLDRVDARRAEVRSQIFAPDSPPLWRLDAYRPPEGDRSFLDRLRDSFGANVGELADFLASYGPQLSFTLACFLAVVVALSLGRDNAVKAAEADPALTATARIFVRPAAAASVVAMVATFPLYRRIPGVASDLLGMILLSGMLRILPAELWHTFRAGLWVLAGLFATGSMRSWLGFAPILDRLLLLAEALVGAGLFLWLWRPDKHEPLARIGRFAPTVRPVAAAGVLLLVVAALTNVVGLVSASRLIVRATLQSTFVAVALYALARVLGGVVTVAIRSPLAQRLRALRDDGPLVRRRTLSTIYWSITAIWAWMTLRLFRVSDDVWQGASAVLGAKLELGTMSLSLGDIVSFGLVIWVSWLLSRFLRFVLEADVFPHLALPRGVPYAISTGVQYAILLLGAVLAVGAAGIDLSRFGLLAGALGVGIGFGLQNVVNNFVSGLILLFERPVQKGDSVDVGGVIGEITRIGIRSSTVRTPEGADVIVPNANLISDRVVNWTFADRDRRIDITVGVAYGTDPEKVIALLTDVARANPEVSRLPEPIALFAAFGESSLDFVLRVWTRFDVFVRVKSDLSVAVHAALRDAGIEIPFPQRDLHVKVETAGAATLLVPPAGEPD